VVEIVQVSARGRGSGAEVRRRIASVYGLRAGVVFKQVIYLDRAEAPPPGCHLVRPDSHC
jgi:hypothetical protein